MWTNQPMWMQLLELVYICTFQGGPNLTSTSAAHCTYLVIHTIQKMYCMLIKSVSF